MSIVLTYADKFFSSALAQLADVYCTRTSIKFGICVLERC